MLLVVAHDTIAHVEALEKLFEAIDEPKNLPPTERIRKQLREARNLLAARRDERVLYWRLTGKHTPHVKKIYKRLQIDLPDGTIDKEIISFSSPQGATKEETAEGYESVGTVGDMLSLRDLHSALKDLEAALEALTV